MSDAERPSSKRAAIITMVHDEAVFFPIWLRYYSRHFAPEDIYVLDHDTTDGSTDREGFVHIPVSHDRVDHVWMVDTIETLQHELIEKYRAVLVTDVDEIVAPSPDRETLAEYIDRFDGEFVNCHGYELIHRRDREPPLRLDRPVLAQRRSWFETGLYNKPLLATVPMRWIPGFHARTDVQINYDADLHLIHLHRMDYEICRERHRLRRTRRWNEVDLEARWAAHNRIIDDEQFDHWFYEDTGWDYPLVVEEMPSKWEGIF